MLIDVHCHLDHALYSKDIETVISNSKKEGVVKIIAAGIDHHTNKIVLDLAKKYDIVEASLGRYPEDALDSEDYYSEKGPTIKTTVDEDIAFMMKHRKEFIAIGEVGLDLHTGKDIASQIVTIKKLIQLSIELGKPLVIHSRKAEKETLDVLGSFQGKLECDKVILHCFSGRKSLIKEAIANGYNFSIPANIVRAENFKTLVSMCPMKHLLTETDGPYLSPFKNEDGSFKRNEPRYVKETIKVMAKIKGITEEDCENQIFMNYQRVFS